MRIDSLLFVHGWATDKWVWEPIASAFKGIDVANMNLPGHGGAEPWDSPTLEPAVRAIERQTARMSGKIIGIGWSLGAQALIASALENVDKFTALILVGATPSFVVKEDFPWAQSRALVKRMLLDMRKNPGETIERFYPLNFTETEHGNEVKGFLKRYRYPGPISCDGSMPGCFPIFKYDEITEALVALFSTDLRARLNELDMPILIIHGKMDGIVPVGAGNYLASAIKGACLKVYENAGHAPFVTETERFERTIRKFLDGL